MKYSYKLYIALALIITVSMVAISTQVGAAPMQQSNLCWVSPVSNYASQGSYTHLNDSAAYSFDYADWSELSSWGHLSYAEFVLSEPVTWVEGVSRVQIYFQGGGANYIGVYTNDGSGNYHQFYGSSRASNWDLQDTTFSSFEITEPYIVTSIMFAFSSDLYIGGIRVYGECTPAVTPTPTTAPIATDMPQGSLPCITATVAATSTIQATMTPYGRATATPAPSRTPGGPSPTPSPSATPYTYTAHFVNSYDSGLITFEQNVSALSAVFNQSETPYKFLRWSGVTGYDGHPGAAWMHTDVGYAGPTVPVTMATMVNEAGIVAFYKPGGGEFFGPIAVSLYARAAYTIESNMAHWVRVWYLDPNYDGAGTAAWFSQWNEYDTTIPVGTYVGGLKVSNTWRQFGAVISPTMGSGRVTAIGFDDYWSYTDGPAGDVTGPCQDYGCVYLDDVRIAYGDAAGMVLPICNPDGTSGVAGSPTTYKMCVINSTPVDMFATCTAPTGVDLGGWLSYLWCNTSHYFGFFTANRDQVDAIIARQSVNEPFGSMSETGYITDDFNTKISVLQTENKTQAQTPIDWARMMLDGSALDRPAHFAVPDMSVAQDYMRSCPSEAMFSSSTASGACMALYMMRQTIIVTFFQWFLNALFVVGILMLIRGDLEKLAS